MSEDTDVMETGGEDKGYVVIGVGPAAYRTRATQTDKPCWFVIPATAALTK